MTGAAWLLSWLAWAAVIGAAHGVALVVVRVQATAALWVEYDRVMRELRE